MGRLQPDAVPWFEPVPRGVYFLRARARLGTHLSPPSNEVMLTVGNVLAPPEGPRDLTHTVNGRTVTLTWQPPFVGLPTSYVIEAGTRGGLANIATFATGNTALTATFNGVPPGTYVVRVRAVNGLGSSVASNERTVVVN